MAKESTFGTAVTPTSYLPFTNITMNPDLGLFSPGVMLGQRSKNIFRVYGEYHFNGAVDGPLYPTNAVPLLVASIGADGGRTGQTLGLGVTGSTGNTNTGTIATTIVGATSVTYTLTAGVAPLVNDIMQIDVNTAGSKTAECRKITAVTGTTSPYTLTLDQPLNYAHASSTAMKNVVSPYTHQIVEATVLDSLTIEKNLGGYQSEQYVGCRVNKMDIKIAAGNTEATMSADVMAYDLNVLTTPSSITVVNEAPFVFAEATLSLYATDVYQAQSATISIANGIKEIYTLSTQHNPQFLPTLTQAITGQIGLVFDSLNDATYGYYTHYLDQAGLSETPGALTLTFTHPSAAGGGAMSFTLPIASLSKYVDDIKLDDVILSTLDYTAFLNLGGSTVNTISATVTDINYLPF